MGLISRVSSRTYRILEIMPNVKLLLFAGAKDAIGKSSIPDFQLELTDYTYTNLSQEIEQKLKFTNNFTYKLALNEEYLNETDVNINISENDEIAIIPPLS